MTKDSLLLFSIDETLYAIPLSYIQSVIRAVEITALPSNHSFKGKNLLKGVISIHGKIAPVINSRSFLGAKEKELEISDQFIIACFEDQLAVLPTDFVLRVIHTEALSSNSLNSNQTLQVQDRIVFIQNAQNIFACADIQGFYSNLEGQKHAT